MIETTYELFQNWKGVNIPVKISRSDNSEKNNLEQRCSSVDWKFGIRFQYTARDMPQHDSEAEVGIFTIESQGRVMMIAENVPYHFETNYSVKP